MNVFGKVHLGYIVVETEKFDDWRRFGRDAIAMHLKQGQGRGTLVHARRSGPIL